jgi:hypothetical protein
MEAIAARTHARGRFLVVSSVSVSRPPANILLLTNLDTVRKYVTENTLIQWKFTAGGMARGGRGLSLRISFELWIAWKFGWITTARRTFKLGRLAHACVRAAVRG